MALEATPRALDYLVDEGYNLKMGARPLKRLIQMEVDNELANLLLSGKLREKSVIAMDYDPERDRLVFESTRDLPPPPGEKVQVENHAEKHGEKHGDA